jgi:hypothetical protein
MVWSQAKTSVVVAHIFLVDERDGCGNCVERSGY